MPLYHFQCPSCSKESRKILRPEVVDEQRCGECNVVLSRDPRPPSSRVTEVLDNGGMTKRLERLADAERLFRERNDAVKKQNGQ